MTRRALLTASALQMAAGRPLAPLRLPAKIRLGIIGLEGHPDEILRPLAQLPDVQLVAYSSASPAKGVLANVRRYTDYNQMLDDQKLDVAAVCNTNGERAAAVLAAIRRGLDVIAEKPLALTHGDLNTIRKEAAARKTHLGMLLPMRFDPQYMAMKKIVDEGLIGEVAQIGAQKSYKAGSRDAWFLKRSSYGGTIPWIGVHMIDLMRHTSGREFREAAGFQSHIGFPELGEMENVTASLFRLDNGGVATLRMDYLRSEKAATHGDDRLRLAGVRGIVEYQEATGVTLMTSERAPDTMASLPAPQSVFLDFLNAAYNGAKPGLTLADIYRVTEIAIGANEAADKGIITRL